MSSRRELGNCGEGIAVAFLERHGYVIVDRQVALRRGEIDIIARQGGDLVFVEVKTRTTEAFGSPAEAVTADKARHIALGVREYLSTHLLEHESVRCDVVCVLLPEGGQPRIEIIRDAIALGDTLDGRGR